MFELNEDSVGLLSIVLAAWGAALSTILAAMRIIEFRHTVGKQLVVSATADSESQQLFVTVVNAGIRAVTITALEIRYGRWAGEAVEVFRTVDQLPRKLEDGEVLSWSIARADIQKAVKQRGIFQTDYSRLWAVLQVPGRRPAYKFVNVDPAFIVSDYTFNTRDYVAADVFLGFPPSELRITSGRILK